MPHRKSSRPIAQIRAAHHLELDDGDAFVPDYRHGFVPSADGDAEAFGEEFIAAATSAEGVGEDARDEIMADEYAGISVESLLEEDGE